MTLSQIVETSLNLLIKILFNSIQQFVGGVVQETCRELSSHCNLNFVNFTWIFQVTSCLRCVLAMSLIKGCFVFFRSPPVWDVFYLRAWLKDVLVFQVTSCLKCVLVTSLIKGCSCFFRSPPVWDVLWLQAWLKDVLVFQGTSCLRCVLAMSLIKGVCVFQVVWDVFYLQAWLKDVLVFQVTSCLRCVLVTSLIKGCSCFSGHLLFEMCFGYELD